MEKKLIYLVRHGESEWNAKGLYQGKTLEGGLTEKGREQAEKLGKWMKKETMPPEIILSSPAKRALETTCILAHELFGEEKGHPIYIVKNFYEVDHGDWEGKTKKEVIQKYPEGYALLSKTPKKMKYPNGESIVGAKRRVWKSWRENIITRDVNIILVVAHAGVNYQILEKIDRKAEWKHQENTAFSMIEIQSNGITRILMKAEIRHLNPSEAQK